MPYRSDGAPVTWQSLIALEISGGLILCLAALVLLLSYIALENIQAHWELWRNDWCGKFALRGLTLENANLAA